MIRKYIVLSLLTLVSIVLGSLLYSSIVSAQGSTVTGYISVPSGAFVPMNNTHRIINYGQALWSDDPQWAQFYAAVQLPHGATVTNVTTYWFDFGPNNVTFRLTRYSMPHATTQTLTEIVSSGAAGDGSSYDDTIDYATVDNSEWAYLLGVRLPPSAGPTYWFKYAVIEYTLPSQAVGGYWIPVDKFSILAPYIALVSTIILAVSMSVAYSKYRKKQ